MFPSDLLLWIIDEGLDGGNIMVVISTVNDLDLLAWACLSGLWMTTTQAFDSFITIYLTSNTNERIRIDDVSQWIIDLW